ncbi:Rsd/AlgQ family anti-sigma factor [Anaerobiospirillum succiniciproducens]|uniref:Rsd/AlgQ family anti-sigma factor n=1 Tax=Anaerobiospirillum succiniciproducens TaxID=13335 RepID=UPI0023563E5D|nr:Rsd/AlgQ family anti-sigma factor [Anaerobiospirillum succiniciproducens]MCI6863690.1 sigma D regulator [Anaerobiospirillum succiniciproducens]
MKDNKISGFNTALQNVEERYSWVNDMINERKQLVLKYMELINPQTKISQSDDPMDQQALEPSYEQVVDFCDALVDYISRGHFDLYPKIVELIENASGRSLSIAHRVMPRIDKTTEVLLQFADRYAEDLDSAKMKTLRSDLSKAGQLLEQRFRNEDRLIIGLRLVNAIVATPRN